MESSSVKTFVLPNKCFQNGAACTWRNGNKFTIYPRSQTLSKSLSESSENVILNIQQNAVLFTPILRKLVNESNCTYLLLQKSTETLVLDNSIELLKLSRQYRSIIRVCIENLQESASRTTDELEKTLLVSYITIFYTIECIWHLCEILFIDNIPGDVVLPYLLEWVRFHFPCHEQTAAQILEVCEKGSEDHPEYWDTVIGMVIQGRIDVARALLKLHSSVDTNDFKLIDNSLKSMPIYNVHGGISTGEFTVTWKHWQAECRSILSSSIFASQPNLELILRLIIGDYSAFESIRDKYDSWFDMVGGWVMFTAPWSRKHELQAAASACAAMRVKIPPSHKPLDDMVRALFDGDLHQVIHDIQEISDNGWFATHLTDMLYHTGKLKILNKHQTDVAFQLRNSLILEYGSILMDHKSLWNVGLSYLASCPPEGLRRAEVLLERIPITSESKALRIIAEAKKYSLHGVVQTVCKCISARHLSHHRIGAALAWAIRAKDVTLCSRAAHEALRNYCDGKPLPATDLLLTAGPGTPIFLADAPLFLVKYCEFHRLYKNREFKKAGKLLVSLLTSKISPDYFWETLLLDTIPLLESDEPIFSSSNTYEIMLCLELRSTNLDSEKSDLLRLALARNLARTVLDDVEAEDA